jgi:hypothetical protein
MMSHEWSERREEITASIRKREGNQRAYGGMHHGRLTELSRTRHMELNGGMLLMVNQTQRQCNPNAMQ